MKTVLFIVALFLMACGGNVEDIASSLGPNKEDIGELPIVRDAIGNCFTVDEGVTRLFQGHATDDLMQATREWEVPISQPALSVGVCRYNVQFANIEEGVAEAEVDDEIIEQRWIRLSATYGAHFRYVGDPKSCRAEKNALLLGVFAEILRAFQAGIPPGHAVAIPSPGCESMLPTDEEVAQANWN